MACDKCSPAPGRMIPIDTLGRCRGCGIHIAPSIRESLSNGRWDKYFHTICEAVSSKSPCLSRQIGAVLVRDKSIISTGYNGPARGFPHCEGSTCPRKIAGHKSGEGLEHCPAAHAETNAIANAARVGVNASGSTLYMNSVIPCKFCAVSIVNAGIEEVVVSFMDFYHKISADIFKHGDVFVRSFKI